MKPEHKQKWIEALRSGEYKQGRMALCLEGRYCCLGVLADITNDEHNTREESLNFVKDVSYSYFDSTALFDKRAQDFYGLSEDACTQLMIMNDAVDDPIGKSFESIADWIEENL